MRRLLTTTTLLITLLIVAALFIAQPLAACSVIQDWVKRGGQQVTVNYMKSTNFWLQSYPGASVLVLQVGLSNHALIYKDSACSQAQSDPFFADSTGYFQVYTNDAQDDLQFSGGGITGTIKYTYTAAPIVGNFITQSQGDARYLQLSGANAPMTGSVNWGGFDISNSGTVAALTLSASHNAASGSALTAAESNAANASPTLLVTTNGNATGASFHNNANTVGLDWQTAGTLLIRGGNSKLLVEGQNAGSSLVTFGSLADGGGHWILGESLDGAGHETNFYLNNAATATFPLTINKTTDAATFTGAITGAGYSGGAIVGTTGAFSSLLSTTNNLSVTGTSLLTGNVTASGTIGIGQAPTAARLTVGAGSTGAQPEEVRVDAGSASGGDAFFSMYRNGVNKGKSGIAGATNGIITGTAANDMAVMSVQDIKWSANGSTAVQMWLNPSGFLVLGTTTALFPLHVKSATSPQIVAEFDPTHRAALWADATNAYSGSTVAIPYKLRSNNVDALTIDTSQNLVAAVEIGIGQTPTARLVVGAGSVGTNAEEARIDAGSGAGGDAFIGLYRNGVNKAKLGVAGSANDLLTGSSANDLNVVNSQAINLSANGSAAIQLMLTSAGQLGIGATSPNFPLHIRSSSSPQVMAEWDATHRTAMGNDGTNGFSGTTTAQPYKLRTNNTDAVTFDTSQNANFAASVGLNDATATYPLSIKKNGAALSGLGNGVAVFTESTGANGLALGYSSTQGAIGDVGGGGLVFVTRAGGAGTWSSQMNITTAGVGITGVISNYQGNSTAGIGVTPVLGSVALTNQAASIGTTNVVTGIGQGPYFVCWVQTITTAATSTSSLLTTIGWTNAAGVAKTTTLNNDLSGGTTQTTADASNTLGSERSYCAEITLTGGAITYATTYATSGATTMKYSLVVRVIKQ